jgi:sugar phosphate isomerase/epimerase
MKTSLGHLGYCTNIHSGEEWENHFSILKESIPEIKSRTSPDQPFGIGLRVANKASIDLTKNPEPFKQWLRDNDCYIFTMNGFPYGEFHDTAVKDQVHSPDWTTNERRDYTIRLFRLLADLIPNDLKTAGISTSPLSYRFWWETPEKFKNAIEQSTRNILHVVQELVQIKKESGKSLHLDIEPEPDGILENSSEFIDWYTNYLLPMAGQIWDNADKIIREHVQLCYDVCHFAVGFENPEEIVDKLNESGIKTGKIQISSALKIDLRIDAERKIETLAGFNEPVYLHQVVALKKDGSFDLFSDLPEALRAFEPEKYDEWRVHFHVPLFAENYQVLESTQSDIIKTIEVLRKTGFTDQMEVETYTWSVLPTDLQLPLNDSIARELEWVKTILK